MKTRIYITCIMSVICIIVRRVKQHMLIINTIRKSTMAMKNGFKNFLSVDKEPNNNPFSIARVNLSLV